MKKYIKRSLLALAILAFVLISTKVAFADSKTLQCGVIPQGVCDAALQAQANSANPAGGLKPIIDWIANVIVGVFGAVAVIIIIASGVQMSASAGNENVVKQAKENIFKVVTAVILLISFRAILELVQRLFTGVNISSTTNPLPPLFNSNGTLYPDVIPRILTNATSIASFAAGVVSLIFIIVGGIRYTTSGGNSNALAAAKKTIAYAIAGLVISISAYGILLFIQTQLQK